ncbi:MAG TPA: helix-turn-helix domain-containing protein, partial [Polyangia bacterium]|nr:helix-turn-helix domain-containing protein [Polyangia bacterium]
LVADLERDLINRALEKANGVRKAAAALLGISFRSLRYRLAKLGVADDSDGDDAGAGIGSGRSSDDSSDGGG